MEEKGANTGKAVVGEPGGGAISMWEPEEAAAVAADPTAMGMDTWRGAVNGLKAGLSRESRSLTWWRCCASRAISSAGMRTGAGGGVDSTSRNLTNSWENDCQPNTTHTTINVWKHTSSIFSSSDKVIAHNHNASCFL